MLITKRITVLVIIAILLIPGTAAFANGGQADSLQSGSVSFTDIGDGHWAHDAVMWMVQRKILSGYPDGTFKPQNPVSREEFAKMMVLALHLNIIKPETASFRDVNRQNWAYPFIETARPYLTGFRSADGDYFMPKALAVREDMAVALVKAKNLSNEPVDESMLNTFNDRDSISSNLKKYVSIAVKQSIMQGYPIEGSALKEFKPQDTLTRAEAAVLLYNVIKDEKVTYDGEKVTYDSSSQTQTQTVDSGAADYAVPQVTVERIERKLVLKWQRIDDERLQGYKVVVSKNNTVPKYPEDGYMFWITDKGRIYAVIQANDSYNGGDFGGRLAGGEHYYFSVTAVYNDKKVPGNSVYYEVPRAGENSAPAGNENSRSKPAAYRVPQVTAAEEDGKLILKWQRISDERFQGYKVVISKNNAKPRYPDDGYLYYITDRDKTYAVIDNKDSYNNGDFGEHLVPGQKYYFSITTVYNEANVPSNVIYMEYPANDNNNGP